MAGFYVKILARSEVCFALPFPKKGSAERAFSKIDDTDPDLFVAVEGKTCLFEVGQIEKVDRFVV